MDPHAIVAILAIAEDSLKFPELRHLHDEALAVLREVHLELVAVPEVEGLSEEVGEEVEDVGE